MRAIVCGFLLAYAGVAANAAPVSPPAFLKKGANLQKLLDITGELWLAPDIDYRSLGGKPLKVPSGAKILSRWNARLPVLVIEGGVHDVWIEGLDGGGSEEPDIVFTGGVPNRNITIIGGNGGRIGIAGRLKVRLEDDSRVEGLNLAEYGALEVLQGTSGYVHDSVFSHALGYRPGSTIWWEGNEDEPSAGNSFFHISSITPQWKSRWHYAGPLFLVGWDCESWNGNFNGDKNCFEVTNLPSLISIGLSGGTVYGAKNGALAKFEDVPLVVDFSSRPLGGELEHADLIYSKVGDNFAMFRSTFRLKDHFPVGPRTVVPDLSPEKNPAVFDPSEAIRTLLKSQGFPGVLSEAETGFAAPPFASGILAPVPLAGCSVNNECAAYIQALIDRDGVARLLPGVYKLSRAIKLGSMERIEGVVASAPGEIQLVAAGDFPVVQGRGVAPQLRGTMQQQSVVLSGVALVGGSYGISWDGRSEYFGPGVTIAASTFEHVRFTRQAVAGVAAIGITGIDSNSWRRVLFQDLPVAWLGIGNGTALGMNYADKQGFMFCSFEDVRDAVWNWGSVRPSGGNFWFRSKFDRVGNVSRTRSAYNLTWIQSTFNDVDADRGFKILDDGRTETGNFFMVSSRWTGRGPVVVSDTGSGGQTAILLGSELLQSGSRLVGQEKGTTLFIWNSKVGSPLPDPITAPHVIINTVFKNTSTDISLRN